VRHYPNPGYLGTSSHTTIFNHIPRDGEDVSGPDSATSPASTTVTFVPSAAESLTKQGAEALRDAVTLFSLDALKQLVTFWRARGVNLALAEPFVEQCVGSMDVLVPGTSERNGAQYLERARHLLQNSQRPLVADRATSLPTYAAQFLGGNIRWETLGIFASSVARATIDVPFFPTLYTTEEKRRELRAWATRLSNVSLEVALSLDCLNDLQLVLQYENFILNSYVSGDQSTL